MNGRSGGSLKGPPVYVPVYVNALLGERRVYEARQDLSSYGDTLLGERRVYEARQGLSSYGDALKTLSDQKWPAHPLTVDYSKIFGVFGAIL